MPDFQWSWNGVPFGDGTQIDLVRVDGLGSVDLRTNDTDRAGAHGTWWGRSWGRGRSITVELEASGSTTAALEVAWSPLLAEFAPSDSLGVLSWQLPGQAARQVAAELRRWAFPIDNEYALGFATLVAEWYAPDPRIYAAAQTVLSTGLPTLSGGLSFPASAPFVFGTAGAGGSLAASNNGTIETPWVATFTGPLVAPAIEHSGQARTLSLSGASLAAGETLVIDSAARTVLLNGTASRYSWLAASSQWFTLEPGANALRFTAASGSGTCQIAYRDAWL
jgi:hypothetical protein